jgi:hypothetical protein
MDLTSTPFITYQEIDTKGTDLFEDAFGFNTGFDDVFQLLEEYEPLPEEYLISSIIEHFRELG